MNDILGKMGGNWKDIKKDLNMHEEYEKACDRNPFIRSHLDPDIPSPRAGKAKNNWLDKPGLDHPKHAEWLQSQHPDVYSFRKPSGLPLPARPSDPAGPSAASGDASGLGSSAGGTGQARRDDVGRAT
jgi:hypothetical protein